MSDIAPPLVDPPHRHPTPQMVVDNFIVNQAGSLMYGVALMKAQLLLLSTTGIPEVMREWFYGELAQCAAIFGEKEQANG